MSMAERKTMTRAVKKPVKRKLTRAEKKEIAAVIQAAKGDGKPHTAQQTIANLIIKQCSLDSIYPRYPESLLPHVQEGNNNLPGCTLRTTTRKLSFPGSSSS